MNSREENFRGAKLTEKRTGGVAMQFQVQAGAPGKKTSGDAKLTEDERGANAV